MGNWAFIAAILLAAFYLATSLYISSHRLLWVDEILTVLNTRLPSWTTIWKAAAQGADGLPPIYFMVVRPFDDLLGHTDLSIRLPSALALTAGLLLTFDCARRLTDGLHGLIALSVLCCSFLPYYGHEARSYALYFMFAALALWIWAYDKNNSRVGALFFGVVIFPGCRDALLRDSVSCALRGLGGHELETLASTFAQDDRSIVGRGLCCSGFVDPNPGWKASVPARLLG